MALMKSKAKKNKAKVDVVQRTIKNAPSYKNESSSGSPSPSLKLQSDSSHSRSPSPKTSKKSTSKNRQVLYSPASSDESSEDEYAKSNLYLKKSSKVKKTDGYKNEINRLRAKNEILLHENKSLKKKNFKLAGEKSDLLTKIENIEAAKTKEIEKCDLDKNFWRNKAETLEKQKAQIIREDPYREMVERLVMNERDNEIRVQAIYGELKDRYGIDNFSKLTEVGRCSTEIARNVRVKHIDLHKFSARRIKDIPLWNDELNVKRCILSGRIGRDGLYDERTEQINRPSN